MSHVTKVDTSELTENVSKAWVHLHDLHKHLRKKKSSSALSKLRARSLKAMSFIKRRIL